MRLSSLHLLLCAASSSVSAASATAQVFLFDSDTSAQATPSAETVDAATARLILAQRLHLGQFHALSNVDDNAIRQINAFSTEQEPLFGQDRHAEAISKVMVVIENVKQDFTVPALRDFQSFSISPAPHPADTQDLFSTLSSQASQISLTDGLDYSILRSLAPLSEIEGNKLNTYRNSRTLLYVANPSASSKSNDLETLSAVVEDLRNLARSHRVALSLIFTPPAHLCDKASKTPYGLAKRSVKLANVQPEKPLISDKIQQAPSKASLSPINPVRATKVLSGAIPTCFSSRSSCERSTNNCTSHGECILKWSSETRDENGGIQKQDCFGCACTKPDVRTNKDGTKKTTKYGGAACHKKDIVSPFWLLAGTTVFLMFIVSFGLGMLYTMGNQELPSVIGAGVSGPKAR